MYLLAKSPEKQDKLKEEIDSVVGDSETVTPAHIARMHYLFRVLKESWRLYPLGGHARVLQADTELSGYLVPKGTFVLVPTYWMARDEEIFQRPEEFLPERW